MNTNALQKIKPQQWIALFIFTHIYVWTLTPFFIRYTLPMDAIEGFIWGHQFEWGYDKNPFLNGWLTGIAAHLSGYSDWLIYFCSQLSVGICFWAVWKLARQMISPMYAVISVLLLESIQYYNLHAIDFNDNTLELALWAVTTLFFYQALRQPLTRNWIWLGILAGLGMMTKYYTALLLLSMMLFILIPAMNRYHLKRQHFYWGMLAFIIVITPHVIWLCFHNFITVQYALMRVQNLQSIQKPFFYTLLFTRQQFIVLIPFFILLVSLFVGKKSTPPIKRFHLDTFDNLFLLYVGLGPFLITLLLSAITGMRLRAGWGEPLFSLWGIIFIVWLQPYITQRRFLRFILIIFGLLFALAISYSIALIRAEKPSSANFPGKNIAMTLTREWINQYHTPLRYVAGSRWVAGNISFYSTNHPQVYINWDNQVSPWIDEEQIRKKGAIFTWDTTEDNQKSTDEIKKRFPRMGALKTFQFDWMRNKKMDPIRITVSFLPPENTAAS